jgi:uncharacterized Fe-S cluster-containing MiaB family protein
MNRYATINQKRPREIVLLRGRGCVWRKCTFCDYHLDSSVDEQENFQLNKQILAKVTGRYGELEVINSGSVFELDDKTLDLIKSVCVERGIDVLHFESHWLFRNKIEELRVRFEGIDLKMKLGLETFDYHLREDILKKGILETDPAKIAEGFDEANLLLGVAGQSVSTIQNDIECALENFERICLNVMCENSTTVQPDAQLIDKLKRDLLPRYANDLRVDILINNTDFGVGD